MATHDAIDAQWVEPEVQKLLNDLEDVREWCPCAKCANFFGLGCPCCTGCIQTRPTNAYFVYEVAADVTSDERAHLMDSGMKAYFIGLPRENDANGTTVWYAYMETPMAPFNSDARFTRQVYNRRLYRSDRDFDYDRRMADEARKRKEDGLPRRKRWACSNQSMCTIL